MTSERKAFLMLRADEGLELKPYRCTAGKLTIGVGRNIQDVGITEDEAAYLLTNDVRRSEADCINVFGEDMWKSWGENRRLGWINLMFNLGVSTFSSFVNTLAAARAGDWAKVGEHLKKSRWYAQVKGRGPRVVSMIVEEKFPYA